MKVKKYVTQFIAILMCVVVLSLSIGGNFCFYNNIAKAHAAGTVTITLGSLALEEIILSIAIAVLGAEVAYQYRDEIIDAFKEYSENGSTLYTRNNLMEFYYNGEYYSLDWDDYAEMLKGMGSTASESFDDYKEKFNNTYVKPAKEYLQYVADFYTDLFTGSPVIGDSTYIDGLAEYLKQEYFDSSIIDQMLSGETYELKIDYIYNNEWCNIYTKNVRVYGSCHMENTGFVASYRSTSTAGHECLSLWDSSNPFNININLIWECGHDTHSQLWKNRSNISYHSLTANIPIFSSYVEMDEFLKTGEGLENALNYKTALDAIAVTGDDIPTVGNWEELWERLKNPDLPWWFLNPDALPGTNAVDLPWFDVAGLHDWANDIPNVRDGIIDTNPDIPWSDVWDKVIDIPDVIIPEIDFPYPGVQDPSIPKVDDPVKPGVYDPSTDKPLDLTDEMEGIADYVPTLADSFTDLGNGLKTKFPFSIPWDIHYILSGLATTPKAPRFELPLKVERYGIDETIVVDMARFQVLSDLSRSIFSLLFAVVLINLTIKVIGSLKEE